MADRSKIAAKIAALRAKTSNAGCTEAEALAAAELAARLMAEHGLSETEIEMVSASAEERTTRATWRGRVAWAVSVATNTAAVFHPGTAFEFIGRTPGPEVAAYLYVVMTNAIVRRSRDFRETAEYRRRRTTKTRRAALADFATGMEARLRIRLFELFRSTISADVRKAAGQALVEWYPDTCKIGMPEHKPRFAGAVAAGYAAGKSVTLAHGVGGADGQPLAIETSS